MSVFNLAQKRSFPPLCIEKQLYARHGPFFEKKNSKNSKNLCHFSKKSKKNRKKFTLQILMNFLSEAVSDYQCEMVFLHYFGISIQLKGHFSVAKCTNDPRNVQISLLE
jgi:hypothetical protein